MTSVENGKRVARNTLMLYFRMALIMLVSLYTSRVILNALGVVDFGIYNLVAGVVVLFTFLNSALMNASQRYLSIAVAQTDQNNLQKVFSTCLVLQVILCLIFILFAESIGLYFLNNKLSIPPERLNAANWVYQMSVISTCIYILKVPYHSIIIATEDMSFFAWLSIIETLFKLGIAYVISLVRFDRLIFYSFLLLIVSLLIWFAYVIKAHRSYNLGLSFKYEPAKLKEIALFSGWNIIGGVADVGYKQGTDIILNIFSGVTLNAAMGIATQVRGAIYSFVSNLQIAANPQIIKSYNSGELKYYRLLIYRISKYSFYLIFLLSIPLILNMDFLLKIWLKNPPEYSIAFCKLTLTFCLVDSLSGPLWTSMQAMGKIRNYQILTSCLLLLNLPVSYLALKSGCAPDVIFYIQIGICFVILCVRVLFSNKYASLPIMSYLKEVILPIALVIIISLPLPLIISLETDGWFRLLITSFFSVLAIMTSIWLIGLKNDERKFVLKYLSSKMKKK